MGLFNHSNFSKPGKGVSRNAPKKRGFFMFFELLGRKFWSLCTLSLTYTLASIPFFAIYLFLSTLLVSAFAKAEGSTTIMAYTAISISLLFVMYLGAGPASAGHSKILTDFSREYPVFLWSDFWEAFKKKFLPSILVFALDIVVIFLFIFAALFYFGDFDIGLPMFFRLLLGILMLVFCLIYVLMHPFIYCLIADKGLRFSEVMSLAFTMTMAKLLGMIFVFLSSLAVLAVIAGLVLFVAGFFIFLLPVAVFSINQFMLTFYAVQIIDLYLPKENKNSDDSSEAIFED